LTFDRKSHGPPRAAVEETTMTTDLLLAIAHHLLFFALIAIFTAETVLMRPGLADETLRRLGRLDRAYGMVAGLVIIVGFSRVFFGLKGWEFYIYNWVFWAKIAAFVTVGAISALPTARIVRWNQALRADPGHVVPDGEIATVRTWLQAEGMVFILIPVFAAAMARGYGI
jgi:putative membrane protein